MFYSYIGALAVKILEQFDEDKDMSLVDVDMVRHSTNTYGRCSDQKE